VVDKNLDNLNFLAQKYKNAEFEFLFKKYSSTINDLMKLNSIKQEYLKIDIKNILILIENKLYEEYEKSLNKQQQIAFLLFVISIIFLIFSILAYIKSAKIKKELKAFKYAVENSDNSIVMTDKDRKITYVNESFEKVTGYKRADAL